MKMLILIVNRTAKFVVIALTPLVAVNSALAVEWFVDASITTPGAGTGWGNGVAFKYLSDALDATNPQGGDVIRIRGATGAGLTYVTDQSAADPNGSCTPGPCDPSISFVVDKDVLVLGQHTGSGTTRDPAYRTILSGAISGSERSLHVVRIDGVSGATQIDGLEIADGAADATGQGDDARGGGILLGATDAASPLIRACTIRDNEAGFLGAGAFFYDGSPTLRKTNFINNSAISAETGAGGGGLVMRPTTSSPPNDLLLLAVRFEGNTAIGPFQARAGGAWIWEQTRKVDIIDSAFVNNLVDTEGLGGGGGLVLRFAPECAGYEGCEEDPGGVFSCEPCPPPCDPEEVTYANVINTLFVGNDSRDEGGGAAKINRPTNFINCTVVGNTTGDTTHGGAGIHLNHGTCSTFLNTVVHGNTISGSSSLSAFQKQIFQSLSELGQAGDITFERCDIEGISATSYEICGSTPTSTCNIDADPKFVDAAGGVTTASAPVRPAATSALMRTCPTTPTMSMRTVMTMSRRLIWTSGPASTAHRWTSAPTSSAASATWIVIATWTASTRRCCWANGADHRHTLPVHRTAQVTSTAIARWTAPTWRGC